MGCCFPSRRRYTSLVDNDSRDTSYQCSTSTGYRFNAPPTSDQGKQGTCLAHALSRLVYQHTQVFYKIELEWHQLVHSLSYIRTQHPNGDPLTFVDKINEGRLRLNGTFQETNKKENFDVKLIMEEIYSVKNYNNPFNRVRKYILYRIMETTSKIGTRLLLSYRVKMSSETLKTKNKHLDQFGYAGHAVELVRVCSAKAVNNVLPIEYVNKYPYHWDMSHIVERYDYIYHNDLGAICLINADTLGAICKNSWGQCADEWLWIPHYLWKGVYHLWDPKISSVEYGSGILKEVPLNGWNR
eukprot:473044_1